MSSRAGAGSGIQAYGFALDTGLNEKSARPGIPRVAERTGAPNSSRFKIEQARMPVPDRGG